MSYEFKKLADVEALPEVPEVATVFAEVNGEVKRIPSSGLGGVVKTAIFKEAYYDDCVAYMVNGGGGESYSATMDASGSDYNFSCINMTFEEAYETMANGEPLDAIIMVPADGAINMHGTVIFGGTAIFGMPALIINEPMSDMYAFWTADGIYMNPPGGPS